jgi:putative Mg2+ transporter-C (MgtC) family protein
MSEGEMCLRILAAFGFGAVVGLERQFSHKAAGLRTNIVVSVAAALLTTSSLLLEQELDVSGEALRVTAGIVTGIGFIGAGAIIQTRGAVVGLTTAATVFMSAALGIAVGSGFYYIALTAAGLTVFANWLLRPLDPVVEEVGGDRPSRPDGEPRRFNPARPTSIRHGSGDQE